MKPIIFLVLLFLVLINTPLFAAFPVKHAPQPANSAPVKQAIQNLSVSSADGEEGTTNATAFFSLICGILGLFVLPIVCGPLAIVFGVLGMLGNKPHKVLAFLGLLLGLIILVFAILN
jgi:hypothetical protein